jgi:hypothetical protein
VKQRNHEAHERHEEVLMSFAFLRLGSGQVFAVGFISSFVLFAAFAVIFPFSSLVAALPR